MSSTIQEDEFTEVTHDRKKRKASNSPMLPSQSKPGSSEPSPGTPVRPKLSYKNKIPVIISGVDDKYKAWRQLMGELRVPPQSQNYEYQGTTKRRFCSDWRLRPRRDYHTKRN